MNRNSKSKGFGPANTKFNARNLRNGQTAVVDAKQSRRSYEVWAEMIEKTDGQEGDEYFIEWQRSGFKCTNSFTKVTGVWEPR